MHSYCNRPVLDSKKVNIEGKDKLFVVVCVGVVLDRQLVGG